MSRAKIKDYLAYRAAFIWIGYDSFLASGFPKVDNFFLHEKDTVHKNISSVTSSFSFYMTVFVWKHNQSTLCVFWSTTCHVIPVRDSHLGSQAGQETTVPKK